MYADPSGRVVYGVGLRLLAWWDCGSESRRGHGRLLWVLCVLCVLTGRGLCVGLITLPEESYRVGCVWLWSRILDIEEVLAHCGCCAIVKKRHFILLKSEFNYIEAVGTSKNRQNGTVSLRHLRHRYSIMHFYFSYVYDSSRSLIDRRTALPSKYGI